MTHISKSQVVPVARSPHHRSAAKKFGNALVTAMELRVCTSNGDHPLSGGSYEAYPPNDRVEPAVDAHGTTALKLQPTEAVL
ncbi:hypothetical protein EVAR_25348_1 [Eumeta japonica]|uniref:Uncharacterized protein n=1 Tax=Eumeta variegata TaxID=151549 RepID=A0A4C1XZG0_EUMVA|nr:hypothetical protein EVAR_25348_1 [Eumeta japonica]